MPDSRLQAIQAFRRRPVSQRFRAALRDTMVLLRESGGLLIFFLLALVISAYSFMLLWNSLDTYEPLNFARSMYFVVTMFFFEPTLEFPAEWYLEIYFFIMPAMGLIFLGLGVADFAVLLFNRRQRQSQWEVALASTFNQHIIVCGLGHLGIRVVRQLVMLHEDVVVIERDQENERLEEIKGYDIPVIYGDARNPDLLRKAGLSRASATIICTNDDLTNLQMATRIRDLNADVRVVMRMFEDEFGRTMAEHMKIDAVMSASALAAPAFAGSATQMEIIQTLSVAGRVLSMGRVGIRAGSRLDGCTVGTLEDELDVSVILLQSNDSVDITPSNDVVLKADDEISVIAELPTLREMGSWWNRPVRAKERD